MTPSRDNRAGNLTVRVRPFVNDPDTKYVWIEEDESNPKSYKNVKLKTSIPAEVVAAGDSYWRVTVGDGNIRFHNQVDRGECAVSNETFVFDEDGEVQYDILVEKLIEKVELDLRDPDKYRFNGLNDEQWTEVKRLAHEQINGRG